MFDLVSLGEILIDFTPSGTTEQGIPLFAQNPGGAPANVLAMNSKLGGSSAFLGKVGPDHFGAYLEHTLKCHGIDTSGLTVDEEIPTTLAFVHLDETGDRSFTFYRKPGADLRLTWTEVKKELIDACKIFHFGSVSLTDDPCRTAALEAAFYAKSHGKIVSFDPNYRPVLWKDPHSAHQWIAKGISLADILKVSEEEMLLMTNQSDPALGSQILLDQGPKAVFVTLGEHGSYYRSQSCHGLCPAARVNTIDTTGAGDAFMGAVLWQMRDLTLEEISAMDLREIVSFANAAGTLTTTRSGAIPALPFLEEIQHFKNNQEMPL